MNKKTMQFMKPFMENLSSNVDKSVFVGTIIQMIAVCKLKQISDNEGFEIFQNMLYETDFDETITHDYLSIYVNQLSNKKRENFRIAEFEKVIFSMIQESTMKEKDVSEPRDMDYYEAIARRDEAEYLEQGVDDNYEEDNGEDTGILDGDFWNNTKTITMAENLQAAYGSAPLSGKSPFLVHEKSGEKIPINKDVFSIGKDASMVDYAIDGNSTVSRKHAEIIKKGTHYFLSDKGSTNKTYVEGREIRPEEFVEIHNGTKFKLSNEEFTFSYGFSSKC